mmetsp:Transcript_9019/g.26525  ORF Transcript_9019/g.26525 Transcript_9019/m.26525 type:complete len:222 (+) Transcript_9019:130-795(+)
MRPQQSIPICSVAFISFIVSNAISTHKYPKPQIDLVFDVSRVTPTMPCDLLPDRASASSFSSSCILCSCCRMAPWKALAISSWVSDPASTCSTNCASNSVILTASCLCCWRKLCFSISSIARSNFSLAKSLVSLVISACKALRTSTSISSSSLSSTRPSGMIASRRLARSCKTSLSRLAASSCVRTAMCSFSRSMRDCISAPISSSIISSRWLRSSISASL